ncbi:MAG: D-glycero-beta-D-manno-heptose 1-phosphate adenylyltransferase [Bacteroidetes bacterium]|jgi:D-beta-D-heptose 7-phosphate kinase/D-beta-D-heptose 1-phosphate adenosyltransferase|nr:D-glycero-beta-D-manno-heptose 1-phosphate adenylyltransferase [Bacteroidota bacterium]
MGTVVTREQLIGIRRRLRDEGRRVVFTNGCFDIIHRGHVEYLAKAKAKGDVLVVGLNTDASVRRLKGPTRPVVMQDDRAIVMAAIGVVDLVCLFDEDTPLALITAIVPDVLVKGADWPIEKVVGREVVEAAGGQVQTIEFIPDRSTTSIIDRIRSSAG